MLKLTSNAKEIERRLNGFAHKIVPPAVAQGLNRTLDAIEQHELNAMERYLDRPTPFTMNALGKRKANAKHWDATLFVKDIQARYLRYAIKGGTLQTTIAPVKIRLNRFGNIVGKRGGLEAIAAKGNKRFVGEVNGVYGVWERFGRGGSRLRLLVRVATNTERRKRWPFYEIGERVAEQRMARDISEAIRAATHRVTA